jgi:hypothetical protein
MLRSHATGQPVVQILKGPPMRWLVFVAVVAVNLVGVYFALAPDLITFAQVAPPDIQCAGCASPEVQHALIRAAAFGRSQAAGLIRPQMITAVAALNIAAIACLLWRLGFGQRGDQRA